MAYREEEDFNKPFNIRVWLKMKPFLSPYRRHLGAIFGFMIVCALIDVVVPLFQSYAVDNFITPQTVAGVPTFAALYGTVLVVQVLCTLGFCRTAMIVEMNVGRDLKRAAFLHLQQLSFSYYNVTPVGYMMARVMSDTNRIGGMVAWGLIDLMWALVYVVGVLISMLLLNWRLALLVIAIVPFIAIISVYFQKKMLHYNRKMRKTNSRITGAFNEGITGARTSKTLVIEDQNLRDFSELTGQMYTVSMKSIMLSALYIPMVLFFGSLATAFVLVRGGYLVMEQALQLGVLSAFITYAVSIFEPIQQLARIFSDFISMQANIERVTDLLERTPDITDTPEVVAKYGDAFHPKRENWEPIRGDIVFEDVSFKYPDGNEYILEHFNLKVPAGTVVAIVGETGAGKSTLVNLACRFFEPTEGRILVDGRDYRERSQLWLHSNIGYVLQNPHLFSGSILENIRYGRLDATREEIEEAARIVSADKITQKMANGYDSDVGEGGDKLSTGEKQLVSFARAVLADPPIFVLDEATSSIDTQTEQLIQNAINHLLQNRTSFLIAHRLSTIRQADLILVVKNGKIVERGNHQELLRKKGYYYNLYTKQFETEAGAAVFEGAKA